MLNKLSIKAATYILVSTLLLTAAPCLADKWYPWIILNRDKDEKITANFQIMQVDATTMSNSTPSQETLANQDSVDVLFELEDKSEKRISIPITTCYDDMCGIAAKIGSSWKRANAAVNIVELTSPIKRADLIYQGKEIERMVNGVMPLEVSDLSYERTSDGALTVSWKVTSDPSLDYYTTLYTKKTENGPWKTEFLGALRNSTSRKLSFEDFFNYHGKLWVNVKLQQGFNVVEKQAAIDIVDTSYAPPPVTIYEPRSAVNYNPGVPVELFVTLPTYPSVKDVRVTWTSSIDGEIAWDRHAECSNLSPGNHTITVIANDMQGHETRESVDITVDVDKYYSFRPEDKDKISEAEQVEWLGRLSTMKKQYLEQLKEKQKLEFCSDQHRK